MKDKLQSFKDYIIRILNELESDLRKNEIDWIEKRGVFKNEGYVYKENINVFQNEIKSIQKMREVIEEIDISQFTNVTDFKAKIISELEDLYDQSVLMRSGLNLVIKHLHKISEDSLPEIKIE